VNVGRNFTRVNLARRTEHLRLDYRFSLRNEGTNSVPSVSFGKCKNGVDALTFKRHCGRNFALTEARTTSRTLRYESLIHAVGPTLFLTRVYRLGNLNFVDAPCITYYTVVSPEFPRYPNRIRTYPYAG